MDVSDGVTVNAVSPGPPAAPGPPGRIAWAHPPSNTTSAASTTSAETLHHSSPFTSRPAGRTATPASSIAWGVSDCGETDRGRVPGLIDRHYWTNGHVRTNRTATPVTTTSCH